MTNSLALAKHWTDFIASRQEFPAGRQLLAQFKAGKVKSLCMCGCNSYAIAPSQDPNVPRLVPADGKYGSVFELMFQTRSEDGSVEFALFADGEGRLAGLDVDYCANSHPIPEPVSLRELPYHVRVSEGFGA